MFHQIHWMFLLFVVLGFILLITLEIDLVLIGLSAMLHCLFYSTFVIVALYSIISLFLDLNLIGHDRHASEPVFPTEVILEILSRLPVKTLLKLQLVCKEWQSIINDPSYFKQMHMDRSKIASYCHNVNREQTHPGWDLIISLIHGCDGLLLMRNITDEKLCLWNPATRRVLVLPDPQDGSLGLALSFVPSTKTYRVVSFYKVEKEYACEVFTPGQDDNVWRRLNSFPEITISHEKKERVSVVSSGGAVHCVFVGKVGEETNVVIVSLELGTESFTVNRLPKLGPCLGRWKNYWDLDWDGKLAIVDIVGENMEVLELEDYKKGIWSGKKKIVHFPFLEGNGSEVYPLFVREGDICLWLKGEKIFKYTIATGKQTDISHSSDTLVTESKLYPYKPSMICFRGMVPDDRLRAYRRSGPSCNTPTSP